MVLLLMIIMIVTALGVGWILKKVREDIDWENEKFNIKYEKEQIEEKEKGDSA